MSRSGRKSGRVGAFFCGGLVGFLACILTLGGLGCFVYFKVSPNWINKTFKTEIDLGSDEANSKTLNDFVKVVVGISQNKDSYKLSDLKSDFGIEVKDDLFGIDIRDLKDVPISKLGKKVEDKFANISADELRNVSGMNLESSMGKILNKKNIYYYKDNTLYKDDEFTKEVAFKNYSVVEDGTKIKIRDYVATIGVDKKVEIPLWYLPLATGISDFTANMGNAITLYELTEEFGVKLPNFINLTEEELKSYTVNDLETVIKDVQLADILEYTIEGEVVKDKDENVVTGVLAKLATYKVSQVETAINDLTLQDVFDEDDLKEGVMSLIPSNTPLTEIATEFDTKFQTITLEELIDAKVVVLTGDDLNEYNNKKDLYVLGTSIKVKDLKLMDLVNLALENIPTSNTPA